jgi:hypothetical protein
MRGLRSFARKRRALWLTSWWMGWVSKAAAGLPHPKWRWHESQRYKEK